MSLILLAGTEHSRGESLFVGRVGEVLTFDSHSVVVIVAAAVFIEGAACQPVAGINLHAGHVGAHFKHTARYRVGKHSYNLLALGVELIDYPAMVVALADDESRERFSWVG